MEGVRAHSVCGHYDLDPMWLGRGERWELPAMAGCMLVPDQVQHAWHAVRMSVRTAELSETYSSPITWAP